MPKKIKGFQKGNKYRFKKGEHPSVKTEFRKGRKISKKEKERLQKLSKQFGFQEGNHTKTEFEDQGKKSYEPYSIDWTETLKRSIRERDHYICQLCNQYGNNVHHIDYDKENCNPKNLINLCRSCNAKVNFNRKQWTIHFQKKNQRS